MQAPTPQKGSSRSSRKGWLLLCALLALGALWLARSRPGSALAAKPEPSSAPVRTSSYQNRARWSRAATPAAEADASPMIRGTVYDLEGSVVAGAAVVATTFQVAGNIPTVAGSVESDEQGRFQLALPGGSYYLSGNKEGHGPTVAVAHTGEDISLILSRSGIVRGHVYNERREPVQRFSIDILPIARDSNAAPAPLWSQRFDSPDGSFSLARLPGRSVIVRATAEGFAPAFSPVVVGKPTTPRELDFTLTGGCTLTGTVVDGGGAPLPYVFVDAESRRGGGMMGEASLDAASQAETDLEGRFQLEHVTGGDLLVRAYDGSHAVTTLTVKVGACADLQPVKLTMSSGGGIAGVVRRSDGTPLAGARLSVTHRSVGYVNTVSDAEGRYHFDQLPAAKVRLDIQDGGRHTTDTVEVKDGEVVEKNIALFGGAKGELRGRVTAGGKPVGGAQLMVAMNHGAEGMDMRTPTTDADGNYRVPELADGPYLVMVSSTSRAAAATVEAGGLATLDIDVATAPEPVSPPPPVEPAPAQPAGGEPPATQEND